MKQRKGSVQTQIDRPGAAGRSAWSLRGSDDVSQHSPFIWEEQPKPNCENCKFARFKPGKRRGYCRARPMLELGAGGVVLSTQQSKLVTHGRLWAPIMRDEICGRFQR